MALIKILDENISSRIAAGEIVERPASIVKELVENSIDAGANKIEIVIEDGGLKSISVLDNGCGIEKDCVETAFLNHATSKISMEIRSGGNFGTSSDRGELRTFIHIAANV